MKSMYNPKIIILDNDETTGSYKLIFLLYEFLLKSKVGKHIDLGTVVHIIKNYYSRNNVLPMIRPHVGMFLNTLIQLRNHEKLDHIVMLTNQYTGILWTDSTNNRWTISEIIAALLFLEAGGKNSSDLWSAIITRDLTAPIVDGYNIKYLSRVFRALNIPVEAWSYKNVWFIDDYASDRYAKLWSEADLSLKKLPNTFADVSIQSIFENVQPYRIPINYSALEAIVISIINTAQSYNRKNINDDLELLNDIINASKESNMNNDSAATFNKDDTVFISLTTKLKEKYGTINNGGRRTKQSAKQPSILNYFSKV
jgi:hypothetical protein